MGYTSHHFEDPYLMDKCDLVEHVLRLVHEIPRAKRGPFKHYHWWFLYGLASWLVIITRLTRRHVTLLVTLRALICG